MVSLSPESSAASRTVAQWVFQHGGLAAQVQVPGQPAAMIASRDLLPAESFTLVGIKLAGSSALADADLVRGSRAWAA